jgi:hypothetical protein
MLSICAVIAVRNEIHYLPVLLPVLAAQGIEVAILDHGSTDGSHELYSTFWGNPIISLDDLPYDGVYSQTRQLEAKQKIYNKMKHDWVIHHDADEILEHAQSGRNLRDAIEEAADLGCSILNFDEFVFLPEAGIEYLGKNYYRELLRYYFFEPSRIRLNRAWRRDMNFDNVFSGGHVLSGNNIRIHATNHVLRHYIVLSYEHALRKYLHRRYSEEDLRQRWHANRLNLTEKNLALPRSGRYLYQLTAYDTKEFRKDNPATEHYWSWDTSI